MIIKRKCIITGKSNQLDLPVTQTQLDRWKAGLPIQDAMPHLNDDEREFIITGITKETWNQYLKTDETKEIVDGILNPERND